MERSIGLAFTTLTIFAPLAHASHPQHAVKPEGTAGPLEFVASPASSGDRGYVLVRQVLPAQAQSPDRAQSRVIYLNHDGVILRPGDNDSSRQRSTIVTQATAIDGWEVDDDTWSQTAACIAALYAPFNVTVTDEDRAQLRARSRDAAIGSDDLSRR